MVYFVIGLCVVALVAAGVWVMRYSRRVDAEAALALGELGRVLGVPFDAKSRSFQGTVQGREFRLVQGEVHSPGETSDSYVRMRVACAAGMTLELHPQVSKLGAALVGDIELGDPEFDPHVIVRSNDPARIKRIFTPDLRKPVAEWMKRGWIVRLWLRDGNLHCEGGQGLYRRSQIEKSAAVMQFLLRLAPALEAAADR